MIITARHKYKKVNTNLISLKIDNDKIEIATEVKYLGFILDHTFTIQCTFYIYTEKNCKQVIFLF